jgi:hypothetical protein
MLSRKVQARAWGSTFVKLVTNFLLFLSKGKHRMHNTCIDLLYNIYFIYMVVHLRIGVWWKPVALWLPLTRIPCLPYDGLERWNGYA